MLLYIRPDPSRVARVRGGLVESSFVALRREESRPAGVLVPMLPSVDLEFSGEVWFWRGPSPYHFVTVPEAESAELQATSALVTYGWGMIPAEVRIGSTRWTTSLFPKNGGYVVPLKDRVRKAEQIDVGDLVTVRLAVDV